MSIRHVCRHYSRVIWTSFYHCWARNQSVNFKVCIHHCEIMINSVNSPKISTSEAIQNLELLLYKWALPVLRTQILPVDSKLPPHSSCTGNPLSRVGDAYPKQFSRIVLDQLDTNIRLNIRAQFLQSKKERQIIDHLTQKKFEVLYLIPEKCNTNIETFLFISLKRSSSTPSDKTKTTAFE